MYNKENIYYDVLNLGAIRILIIGSGIPKTGTPLLKECTTFQNHLVTLNNH